MEVLDKANFRIKMAGEELVIAVVQDHETDEVLMVAFMNRDALERTLATGTMTYYSTSRKELWVKGGTSGNTQEVREVFMDCDGDALVFRVKQKRAACHEGYYSCFFRRIEDGRLKTAGRKVFDPGDVYK
ncbi:MAG: phosphoribosyl-AMP cyclohydrolase [Euryarchaeota archaeon]|nr:phosphoribosyl-AMP cyclohydrolase [Euryarchaeota archaeon]